MPAPYSYTNQRRAASERGRRMALARWSADRERRDAEWGGLNQAEREALCDDAPVHRDPDTLLWSIPIMDGDGEPVARLDLYPSREGRSDQYRVEVDGETWREAIGMTAVMARVRVAMVRRGRG